MSSQSRLEDRAGDDGQRAIRRPDPAGKESLEPIRCFVVDDERLARLVLRNQLGRHSDLSIVGEASDLDSAISGIRMIGPEVVFLDVGMHQQSGFDLARVLGSQCPLVIFVTAYDQFALQAFDFRAVDYLVKPIDSLRFDKAINRLRERLRPAFVDRLPTRSEEALFVQAGRGGCWIAPRDIAFIQSDRNYSTVTLADGERVIVRQTMAVWKEKLSSPCFVQLDRTLILNLLQIRRTDFSGHFGQVYFAIGTEPLSLGRQGTARLRNVILAASGEDHPMDRSVLIDPR